VPGPSSGVGDSGDCSHSIMNVDVSAVVDVGDRPADVVDGDVAALVDASEGVTIVECSSEQDGGSRGLKR